MTEITNELIHEVLKQLQTGQTETNRKIGVLAESNNQIRQDLRQLNHDVQSLRDELHQVRTEIQVIALAVDEHTERLTALEARTPPLHS